MDERFVDLSEIRGVVFDLDGTVALHDAVSRQYRLLPGALECFRSLEQRNLPFMIFTNGTARPPGEQASALRHQGVPIADGQLVTPASVAADYFVRKGLKEVLLIGGDGARRPLEEAGLRVLTSAEKPSRSDAVFVAWTSTFTQGDLDVACNHIWDGSAFFVSTDARFFANYNGRALSIAGAIAAGISHVTECPAEVIGKPSQHAMAYAASLLGVDIKSIGVVGDDPVLEIGMARRHGAYAIGVTTGVANRERLLEFDRTVGPHVIIDSLGELVKLMAR